MYIVYSQEKDDGIIGQAANGIITAQV